MAFFLLINFTAFSTQEGSIIQVNLQKLKLSVSDQVKPWENRKMDLLRLYLRGPEHPAKVRIRTWLLGIPIFRHAIVKTQYGMFKADRSDLIGRHLWFYGVWEPVTTNVILDLTSEVDVFVDIGAHMGYFSICAALASESLQVISLEPNPLTNQHLVENIELNGLQNVLPILACVWSRKEVLQMFAPRTGNSGTTSFRASSTSSSGSLNHLPHKWEDIEQIWQKKKVARIIVKIDAEGGDFEILNDIITSDQRKSVVSIIVEYHPENGWPLQGENFVKWARERGFTCQTVSRETWDPLSTPPENNLLLSRI